MLQSKIFVIIMQMEKNLDIRVYESQININNENLVFTYYQNYNSANNSFSNQYPDPANISVGNGSVVYVMAKFRNSSCFRFLELILILHFIRLFISIKMRCLKFVINLNFESLLICLKATSQIFDQNNNQVQLSDLVITYYATETDANNGTSVGRITLLMLLLLLMSMFMLDFNLELMAAIQ